MEKQKTWFVTGASKGFGLALVKQLLERGQMVAATSRNVPELVSAVDARDGFLPLSVDLNNEENVSIAIAKTIKHFGGIDVVVNNAGFGLAGALEELTDAEVRSNFDINVFGTLNVIRNVMPHMRKQRSGHIFNISSIGGFTGAFAGWGIYCATKFAVHGLTESLATEAKPFGIHVTDVAPGYFRTNFLSSGSMVTPKNEIADYTEVRASQQFHQQTMNGRQQGDPEKAAIAIIEVAGSSNPPVHLFLGQDAYDIAYKKIEAIQDDLENWKDLTIATAVEEQLVQQ